MNDVMSVVVEPAVRDAILMLNNGIPQHKILISLVAAAEKMAGGGSVCSILLLDKEGRLRNGASPQLPYDYLTAQWKSLKLTGIGIEKKTYMVK